MGWFDGFPFVSAEQRKRNQQDFERRIFPFGLEAHRAAAKGLLSQIITAPLSEEERLFAYIMAKDKYLLNDRGEAGLQAARKQLATLRWLNERDRELLLAMVRLEAEAPSLDAYPGPEAIRKAAR
jgi:hypothetical protein